LFLFYFMYYLVFVAEDCDSRGVTRKPRSPDGRGNKSLKWHGLAGECYSTHGRSGRVKQQTRKHGARADEWEIYTGRMGRWIFSSPYVGLQRNINRCRSCTNSVTHKYWLVPCFRAIERSSLILNFSHIFPCIDQILITKSDKKLKFFWFWISVFKNSSFIDTNNRTAWLIIE
jgi:hypothetical protein